MPRASALWVGGKPACVPCCRPFPSRNRRSAYRLDSIDMLQALLLSELAGVRHGFFTRSGGVSHGVYATLNGGTGSNDVPGNVAENRARMAIALGVTPDRFLTAYQIHSPDVVVVEEPWTHDRRPHADAIVTRLPRPALGGAP